MKFLFDMHTHTIASGHAYSTMIENIQYAKRRKLKAYGFSDHSEAVRGSVNNIYFSNFRVLPDTIDGVLLFGGVEANIMDFDGNLDISDKILARVDYGIASLHSICIKPGSVYENTQAIINVMKNKYIKIIGHPDDGSFPLDYEKLVLAAKENNVLLELNNSSLNPNGARVNTRENICILLEKCKKYNVRVIVNSDAHINTDVGNFVEIKKLLKEVKFPKELIANLFMDRMKWFLNECGVLKFERNYEV